MALASYDLTNGEWKKISDAGESGVAWLKDYSGKNPRVVIAHTTTTQTPDTDDITYANGLVDDLNIDIAYRLPFGDFKISDVLTADSESDIFYATVLGEGNTATIITDFI